MSRHCDCCCTSLAAMPAGSASVRHSSNMQPWLACCKSRTLTNHNISSTDSKQQDPATVLRFFEHAANVFCCSASFVLAVGHGHLQRFWLGMLLPQACLAPHHILPGITSSFLCKKNHFFLRSCGQESSHGCKVQSVVQRVHTYCSTWSVMLCVDLLCVACGAQLIYGDEYVHLI